MCLITNNIEPIVLREPLTAYKVVAIHKLSPRSKKVTINSIYYKQEWKLGRVYFLPVSSIISHITPRPHFLQEDTYYDINVGFHLYTKDPEQHLNNYRDDPFMTAARMGPFAILEGTVPAGSNIWGNDDVIVSDCFVPKKCYTFIQRKPFSGIKRKPKKLYYKTE